MTIDPQYLRFGLETASALSPLLSLIPIPGASILAEGVRRAPSLEKPISMLADGIGAAFSKGRDRKKRHRAARAKLRKQAKANEPQGFDEIEEEEKRLAAEEEEKAAQLEGLLTQKIEENLSRITSELDSRTRTMSEPTDMGPLITETLAEAEGLGELSVLGDEEESITLLQTGGLGAGG